MAIIKCRMCGRDIPLTGERSWGKCEHCGGEMTFPTTTDPARLEKFNQASELRRKNAFDLAINAYDELLDEDENDAEAHWGALLSWYGIEYVESPTTHAWIPTCHRAQLGSILTDEDYRAALDNAPDAAARALYEHEAQRIAEIQKGILAISEKEPPYDVFICYKERDENGDRTLDSALAQDIYYQLTGQGYRVFFARITLEDKLGQEYEPYIFAALRSARVMLVVGTKPERFNAVWVRNEWGRFLSLMKNDRTRLLIPCYRDMHPYDLPKELSVLQCQDMGKIGFIQDVIRGIRKVLEASKPAVERPSAAAPAAVPAAPSVESLLTRARLFLEDGKWSSADEYAEKVLDIDPKCAEAYIVKVQAARQVSREADLANCEAPLSGESDYEKALRFADAEQKAQYAGYQRAINERQRREREAAEREERERQEAERRQREEQERREAEKRQREEQERREAERRQKEEQQRQEAERRQKEEQERKQAERRQKEEQQRKQAERRQREERERQEREERERRQREERERREREAKERDEQGSAPKKKGNRAIVVVAVVAALAVASGLTYTKVIKPDNVYSSAVEALNAGSESEAYVLFSSLGDYKDASAQAETLRQKVIESLAQRRSELPAYSEKLSAGSFHTVGLKSDGTAVASGPQIGHECDVSDWTDIVAVAAGGMHTVGVRSDNTALAVGYSPDGRCKVSDWTDIVSVSAGDAHTVGLRSDGTVVATGANNGGQCEVSAWTNIVAVSAGYQHTVGLKADNRVIAVGRNLKGECEVYDWTDIVSVAAGANFTVGARADGTVLAKGWNDDGQCDVDDWTDIVAVAAGKKHTVGLRSDGTVVAIGNNEKGQCDVFGWTDIVAVFAGDYHTLGLRSDGKVLAKGWNSDGQLNVSDWDLLD